MAIEIVQCGALITSTLLMIIGLVGLVYLDNVLKKIIEQHSLEMVSTCY